MHAKVAFNVHERGLADGPVLMFAHGFGCDQNMWRPSRPSSRTAIKVVLFDYVGAGGRTSAYDPDRYSTLDGYADDVNEICQELDLDDVVFVGHSVSADDRRPGRARGPRPVRAGS